MRTFISLGGTLLLALAATFSLSDGSVEAYVQVKGYYKSNGTYVAPHVRSNPNGLKYDNYGWTPGQGLYNETYGTRGTYWDTPTSVTDPDYYEGKALYESGSSATSKIPAPTYITPTKATVPTPANASVYGSSWYCNDGYRQVGNACQKVVAPLNATVYGSSWYCNDGYKQVGNVCEKVVAPSNATIYGSSWYCNDGYKQVNNSCQKVVAPSNATVYGSSWYCNDGYRQTNSTCERVVAPTNATVYGASWYCNDGYRQIGNGCQKVIAPANATIYGSSWYCNTGYQQRGNSCVASK